MTKRTSFVTIVNLLTLLVIVSMAFASEGGGHEEKITFVGDWLPRLVNFLIIAGVIVYFMRKPAVDFFKNRSLEIEKAMKGSKEARDQAVAALAEMERKIRDLESETKALIADAQARG